MGSTRSNEEVKPLEKPFNKRRWAETLFVTPNKPTGAVAMGFLLFMRMDAKGEGAAISDAEFMAKCTVSDKACRNFKGWLVKHGFLKIKVRGYRGYTSQYTALIPERNTGIDDDEYRNAIPEQMASVPELDTGIPPPSKENSPHTPLKENKQKQQITTTTTVESDAARGGGAYDELNGSAVDLTAFIARHAPAPDLQTARNMLANNVKAFTAEAMLEAYSLTVAEMASSMIARPYKYLIETARRLKEGRQKRRQSEPSETPEEKLRRIAKEIDEKEAPRWTP